MKYLIITPLILTPLLLTACGGGGGDTDTPPIQQQPTIPPLVTGSFTGVATDLTDNATYETFAVVTGDGEMRVGIVESGESYTTTITINSDGEFSSTADFYDFDGTFAGDLNISGVMTADGYNIDVFDSNNAEVGTVEVTRSDVISDYNKKLSGFFFNGDSDLSQTIIVQEDGTFSGDDYSYSVGPQCQFNGNILEKENNTYGVDINISGCEFAGSYSGLGALLPASITESGYDEAWIHVSDNYNSLIRVGFQLNDEPVQPKLESGLYVSAGEHYTYFMIDPDGNSYNMQYTDDGYYYSESPVLYDGWKVGTYGDAVAGYETLRGRKQGWSIEKTRFEPTSEDPDTLVMRSALEGNDEQSLRYLSESSNTETDLALVNGVYEFTDGTVLDITSEGVFTGSNSSGCVYDGQVDKSTKGPNWYEGQVTLTDCAFAGEFELQGTIFLPKSEDGEEALFLFGKSSDYAVSFFFHPDAMTNN